MAWRVTNPSAKRESFLFIVILLFTTIYYFYVLKRGPLEMDRESRMQNALFFHDDAPNFTVLFISEGQGSGEMRANLVSQMWPGRSRVIRCADLPYHREQYHVAVHVKHACPYAFEVRENFQIGANVWDVVDNYGAIDVITSTRPWGTTSAYGTTSLWDLKWDGIITGTQKMTADFCTPRGLLCAVIPHMSNLNCRKHNILQSSAVRNMPIRVGVLGTAGRVDQKLIDILSRSGKYDIRIEGEYCSNVGSFLLGKHIHRVSLGHLRSCTDPAPCNVYWDHVDVAIMWYKEGNPQHKADYKPCTRLIAASAINIPTIVHEGFACAHDALGEYGDAVLANDANLESKLEELLASPSQHASILKQVQHYTSPAENIKAYQRFFSKLPFYAAAEKNGV